MKLLDEIRQQPLHIRQIFMWSLVVITFSFVGLAWFHQTQDKFVALLQPASTEQPTQKEDQTASPFALIYDSWSSLRASIGDLFQRNSTPSEARKQTTPSPVPPQELPIQ